jgi:hypothetical protein
MRNLTGAARFERKRSMNLGLVTKSWCRMLALSELRASMKKGSTFRIAPVRRNQFNALGCERFIER